MATHVRQSLVAMLVAAAVAVPSSAQAKGGKDGGPKHEARQESRGGGAGGGGGRDKQRGQQHSPRFERHVGGGQAAPAMFVREHREPKHAKRERHRAIEVFSVAERPNRRHSAKAARWKIERSLAPERQRSYVRERGASGPKLSRKHDGAFKQEGKAEKRALKEKLAVGRADDKRERRWAKQQRRTLKQASKIAPVGIYDRLYADTPRLTRYVEAPLYLTPQATPYSSYSNDYGYTPQHWTNDAYSYAESYYPRSYSTLPAYYPYDAGYDAGLGGLFGGGGGELEDILVTLLPFLLGDSLGFGGFAPDQLGADLLGSSLDAPNYAANYSPYYQPELNYGAPAYGDPYQSALVGDDIMSAEQSDLGGDGLMSLLEVALGSGLLGGDMAGLGGFGGGLGDLGGLGGLMGSSGLGAPDPVYAYSDPYSDQRGLLTGWGV